MRDLVIVFPGQGAQRPGMGEDFCKAYPESKAIFDAASKAIDVDMEALCFTENERLNQTEFTQPAILTMEIALLEGLKKHHGFNPRYYGGHSLGEYSALVAAGALPFVDAVQIVRKRGALMQQAVPLGVGAMAALIADQIESLSYQSIVKSAGAEVANFNSKGQSVISGRKEAVEQACAQIKQQFPQITIIPLNVSAPFHCTLMAKIEKEFEGFVRARESRFAPERAEAVVSNFLGGFHTASGMVDALVRQISGSVQWVRNMEALAGKGIEIAEVGPNRVLAKFFATLDVSVKAVIDLRSLQKNFA